ncbi:MAG: hypothetical protein IT314_12675 [Anaerolineales bacterium]|nr:hypothetical protein [Anaerolineales bacterium]
MKLSVFLLVAMFFFGVFAVLFFVSLSGIIGAAALASLLCGLFALVMPKILARVTPKAWIFLGLVVLVGLLISTTSNFAKTTSRLETLWDGISLNFVFLIPLALIAAALLFYSSLNVRDAESPQRPLSALLGALLLAVALRNLYTFTVWDNTYDSLGYIWLFIPFFAILLSGLTLLMTLPSRTKLAGWLYILILPISLALTSSQAQKVDFRAETAERAERIVKAVQSFYAREGRYPESLAELTPRDILAIPAPTIIYGQDWRYESGGASYRLGYVDREHWSDPRLIGRIYKAEGQAFGDSLMCAAEVAAMQQNDPDFQYSYWMESP